MQAHFSNISVEDLHMLTNLLQTNNSLVVLKKLLIHCLAELFNSLLKLRRRLSQQYAKIRDFSFEVIKYRGLNAFLPVNGMF